MLKEIKSHVLVFDAEWVPCVETGKALYGDPGYDGTNEEWEWFERIWEANQREGEGERPFLKPVLSRVVSIAGIYRIANKEGVTLRLFSLCQELSEEQILNNFLQALGKTSVQLVGFNSEASDIPVIAQRAMCYKIVSPAFFRRPDKPWEGQDYFNTSHSTWHVDLLRCLAPGERRLAPRLAEIAACYGLGGKNGHGEDVARLWNERRLDELVRYNEQDAKLTYLLWLRLALCSGLLDPRQVAAEEKAVREILGIEHDNSLLNNEVRRVLISPSFEIRLA